MNTGVESENTNKPNTSVDQLICNRSNRGRVAIFIDGSNLFHTALQLGIEIDYAKLLCHLTQDARLLRAFFYSGMERGNDKQQGFLFWMRRNGYRVVTKELISLPDGSKKSNLDVEIAVDMITLSPYYDTAVLVGGHGDLAYAVNALSYKGVRVEVVSLRGISSDSLIDVADCFIDLDSIKQDIQKAPHSGYNYRSLSNSSL
ncbi:NYN domain-containing protein [Plectonema radiosum NIES-515]|uniref:NYN domain-containing protein n=2 Tax=Plectonema TaxID=1183 RepID=A0ABT3AWZ7_9CYAN|nr:NYN domain-containing protein [Plectonema radiosum]MCV3213641.1 NYN domain-containing protein [Plectonema radiosum NIES-515]